MSVPLWNLSGFSDESVQQIISLFIYGAYDIYYLHAPQAAFAGHNIFEAGLHPASVQPGAKLLSVIAMNERKEG